MSNAERTRRTRADCVVRALAVVADIDYDVADALAAAAGRSAGRGTSLSVQLKMLAAVPGVEFKKPRMGTRSLARFLREHPTGRFYLRKAHHAFGVIDGVVSDRTALGSIVKDAWQLTPAS